jgi:NAD(P)H-dependent FMN reductase
MPAECPPPFAAENLKILRVGCRAICKNPLMHEAVRIALISGSLNPESLSRQMAQHAANTLDSLGAQVDFIDLKEVKLPMCDGDTAYSDPEVERTRSRIAAVAGILVAAPVYNFDMNAALKNLVELTGSAWEGKVVGFLNAAGGDSSYMSVMSMANSLMLDFRCVIVPRFVYATGSGFRDGAVSDKVAGRIDELARDLVHFAKSLAKP